MSNLEHKTIFNETIDEDNRQLRGRFDLVISVNDIIKPIISITIGEILDNLSDEQLMKLKIRIDNELDYSRYLRYLNEW